MVNHTPRLSFTPVWYVQRSSSRITTNCLKPQVVLALSAARGRRVAATTRGGRPPAVAVVHSVPRLPRLPTISPKARHDEMAGAVASCNSLVSQEMKGLLTCRSEVAWRQCCSCAMFATWATCITLDHT